VPTNKGGISSQYKARLRQQNYGNCRRLWASSPHMRSQCFASELTVVRYIIKDRVVEYRPKKLIGDKAHDSDPLDRGVEELFGTETIAPNC